MRRRNHKGRRKETEAVYAEMACASATQETGSSLKPSWVPLFDFDGRYSTSLSHGPNAQPRPN